MRHVRKRIVLSATVFMMAALPVLADGAAGGNSSTEQKRMNPEQQNGKVACMLVVENNCLKGRSAATQIDMLTKEIKKGTAVYSTEELEILNNELDRAKSDLFDEYGGGI